MQTPSLPINNNGTVVWISRNPTFPETALHILGRGKHREAVERAGTTFEVLDQQALGETQFSNS